MAGVMMFYGVILILLFVVAIAVKQGMQRRWDRQQIQKMERILVPPRLLPNPEVYEGKMIYWFALGLAGRRQLLRSDIDAMAEDPLMRFHAFQLLLQCEALHWFPSAYATISMMAESHMVSWLYFPTELACRPDAIQLISIEDIAYEHRPFRFYVYRFKVNPPHDQAEDGWMLGCVGPYMPHDGPIAYPQGTFSRFKKEAETSPRVEAEWNFHNIFVENMRRQYNEN